MMSTVVFLILAAICIVVFLGQYQAVYVNFSYYGQAIASHIFSFLAIGYCYSLNVL